MVTRGRTTIPRFLFLLVIMALIATAAYAGDRRYPFPIKVRVSSDGARELGVGGVGMASRGASDWASPAGASRMEILCARRGFAFALGMRPFFSELSGSVKAVSKGGEGTYLNLHGHLRLPKEKTMWEFYTRLKMWNKVTVGLDYMPWNWSGPGHSGVDGNFAGLLLTRDESMASSLSISSFKLGADYDVSFGRDLTFGPNGEFYIIKWDQRVRSHSGDSGDFAQTMLQPAIGGHMRFEPSNTGYFSWFKPSMDARFSWMSFNGLGLSTWDMGVGIAPPVSRNVDAGFKVGYKQWKLDGVRRRLTVDMGVEGIYLDFGLFF